MKPNRPPTPYARGKTSAAEVGASFDDRKKAQEMARTRQRAVEARERENDGLEHEGDDDDMDNDDDNDEEDDGADHGEEETFNDDAEKGMHDAGSGDTGEPKESGRGNEIERSVRAGKDGECE
jgi:hypothetical protein